MYIYICIYKYTYMLKFGISKHICIYIYTYILCTYIYLCIYKKQDKNSMIS